MQQLLILCQIKTVPVPIIDQNTQAKSYTHLQINNPYIEAKFLSCYAVADNVKSNVALGGAHTLTSHSLGKCTNHLDYAKHIIYNTAKQLGNLASMMV